MAAVKIVQNGVKPGMLMRLKIGSERVQALVPIERVFEVAGYTFCVHRRYPIKPGVEDWCVSEFSTGTGVSCGEIRSAWEAQSRAWLVLNDVKDKLAAAIVQHPVINERMIF